MDEKIENSLRAAQLYYMDGLSQGQIARQLSISNATVSRLLQFARDKGIVRISIEHPMYNAEDIQKILTSNYGIKIQVVPDMYGGTNKAIDSLGLYTADYLIETVESGDVIGIGWGKTIKAVADQMKPTKTDNVEVVMLKGTQSLSYRDNYAYDSIYNFARAFYADPNFLPLPTIFDSARTKELVEQDRFIRRVLDLGLRANVALYTVGTVNPDALLFQLGYLSQNQIDQLQDEAVGDILSHFIDEDAQIVSEELDIRTVGIRLDDLAKKERSILVASGIYKLDAVSAAINGGYCTEAIVDMSLGVALLKEIEEKLDDEND